MQQGQDVLVPADICCTKNRMDHLSESTLQLDLKLKTNNRSKTIESL